MSEILFFYIIKIDRKLLNVSIVLLPPLEKTNFLKLFYLE